MNFIACADLHLSERVPVCRKETPEEWLEHQKKVLSFISNTCNVGGSNLYIAGDVFDKPVVSEPIMNLFLDFVNGIQGKVVVMSGNHDLKFRSDRNHDTSFGVIERAYQSSDWVRVNDPDVCMKYTDTPVSDWPMWYAPTNVVTIHTLCYETKEQCAFGGCSAQELLDKIIGPQYIIVGDQHHGFCYEKDGRYVINCGCVLKRSVDFKDEQLSIWYVDDEGVQAVDLPFDDGVHDEHRVEIKDREGRISILMEKLAHSEKGVTVDFVKNLIDGLTEAGLSDYTESIVRKLVEEKHE